MFRVKTKHLRIYLITGFECDVSFLRHIQFSHFSRKFLMKIFLISINYVRIYPRNLIIITRISLHKADIFFWIYELHNILLDCVTKDRCCITTAPREKPAFCVMLANEIARITTVVNLLLFRTSCFEVDMQMSKNIETENKRKAKPGCRLFLCWKIFFLSWKCCV